MKSKFDAIVTARAIALSACLLLVPTIQSASKYKILHNFRNGEDGAGPAGPLLLGGKAGLYGATAGGDIGCKGSGSRGTVFELRQLANGKWGERILYCFAGQWTDGFPGSGLAADTLGNLYGTSIGGPNDTSTVFELVPERNRWILHLLYDAGAGPGVTLDKTGNVYGEIGLGEYQAGAIAELSPGSGGWTYTQLYSFCGQYDCPDGTGLPAPPIWDPEGDLYGTTEYGGIKQNCWTSLGCGVVFKMKPNKDGAWSYHVLHRFATTSSDGQTPDAGLVLGATGSLYGNTLYGGVYNYGRVFKLTSSGGRWKETPLYDFPSCTDGCFPGGTMVFDAAGNLYGSADGGLANCGGYTCGVVFKLTPQKSDKWKYSVLHKFTGADGGFPWGVILDRKGNLFGTTQAFGKYRAGVAFEITP